MDGDNVLLSHALDLKNRAADCSMITSTAFLDERQQAELKAIARHRKEEVDIFFFGGYAAAERRCAVFVPSFYETGDNIDSYFKDNEDDSGIALLRITKDRFSPALSHRDFLGSIMALGVTKESIGDILADETGAFVFVRSSVYPFLCQNLDRVGRATVKAERVSFDSVKGRKEHFEEIQAFISSERLDIFVGAAFSLSRAKSAEKIEKGLVFLNGLECVKTDARVNVGDKVVLRGSGKTVYFSKNGESKKGRTHITIKKYI